MADIISWGTYLPVWRLDRKEAGKLTHTGGKGQITVPGMDEDAFTMGLEAAFHALEKTDKVPSAVFFASTELPASEQNPAAICAYSLALPEGTRTANFSGSPLAGMDAIQAACDFCGVNKDKYALVVAADAQRKAAVGSRLELLPGAGAVAYLIGSENGVAEVGEFKTIVSVFPDVWEDENGYLQEADNNFRRQQGCARAVGAIYKETGVKADYFAYTQPEDNTVKLLKGYLKDAAPEALPAGEFVSKVGDISAAAPLFSLAKVLEAAEPEKNVVVLGYGGGTATSAVIKTGACIGKMQELSNGTVEKQINSGKYINYVDYLTWKNLIIAD